MGPAKWSAPSLRALPPRIPAFLQFTRHQLERLREHVCDDYPGFRATGVTSRLLAGLSSAYPLDR